VKRAASSATLWELTRAETEYYRIQKVLNSVLSECPNGLPLSAEQFRLMKAGSEECAALENYQRAVHRLRMFAKDGRVPDDLKER
jgi:hypothetical protein